MDTQYIEHSVVFADKRHGMIDIHHCVGVIRRICIFPFSDIIICYYIFIIKQTNSPSYPWYLNYSMVTQNMLRICEGKQDFSEIDFVLATAPDLKKIALNRFTNYQFHSMRAHFNSSDLPSNIKDMVLSGTQ